MNAIPQERRRQFLDELAKITGRALPPEEPIRAEAAFAEQDAKMFANGSALIRVEAVLADQDATLIANGYEPIPSRTGSRRTPPCSTSPRPAPRLPAACEPGTRRWRGLNPSMTAIRPWSACPPY